MASGEGSGVSSGDGPKRSLELALHIPGPSGAMDTQRPQVGAWRCSYRRMRCVDNTDRQTDRQTDR